MAAEAGCPPGVPQVLSNRAPTCLGLLAARWLNLQREHPKIKWSRRPKWSFKVSSDLVLEVVQRPFHPMPFGHTNRLHRENWTSPLNERNSKSSAVCDLSLIPATLLLFSFHSMILHTNISHLSITVPSTWCQSPYGSSLMFFYFISASI